MPSKAVASYSISRRTRPCRALDSCLFHAEPGNCPQFINMEAMVAVSARVEAQVRMTCPAAGRISPLTGVWGTFREACLVACGCPSGEHTFTGLPRPSPLALTWPALPAPPPARTPPCTATASCRPRAGMSRSGAAPWSRSVACSAWTWATCAPCGFSSGENVSTPPGGRSCPSRAWWRGRGPASSALGRGGVAVTQTAWSRGQAELPYRAAAAGLSPGSAARLRAARGAQPSWQSCPSFWWGRGSLVACHAAPSRGCAGSSSLSQRLSTRACPSLYLRVARASGTLMGVASVLGVSPRKPLSAPHQAPTGVHPQVPWTDRGDVARQDAAGAGCPAGGCSAFAAGVPGLWVCWVWPPTPPAATLHGDASPPASEVAHSGL